MNDYLDYSDEELLQLLKTGDKLAFSAIYSRFWPLIYRFARKMLRNEQEAEDLTQEVFFKLWNASGQLDVSKSLSGFLYELARNRVFNLIEHGKVMQKYTSSLGAYLDQAQQDTDHLIREKQLKALIEKEVLALPEQMRIIFELSRNENKSYKEIAEELGITEGAVRGQITRALKQLRGRLGLVAYLYLLLNGW